MIKSFGDSFAWFGRERNDQKSAHGFGGVGILVRKGCGEVSLVKVYERFEVIWIKLVLSADTFFICGVYIPPDEGPRGPQHFVACLGLIEADCIKFRKEGKIVILG